MKPNVPSFAEQLAAARKSAVHLELPDSYGVAGEADAFAAFRRGEWVEADEKRSRQPWLDLVTETVGRGVVIRRARIVSEPVTGYIRYEHAGTQMNVDAGEQVRWLPRRQASDIALPGNDFWLFDGTVVRFNHFTGDGDSAGPSVSDDPTVAELCASAFEAVWERGIDHAKYSV